MDQPGPALPRWLQLLPHPLLTALQFQLNGAAGEYSASEEAEGDSEGEQRLVEVQQKRLQFQRLHVQPIRDQAEGPLVSSEGVFL